MLESLFGTVVSAVHGGQARAVQFMVGLVGRSEQYSSWWGWWVGQYRSWWGWWVGQISTVRGGAGG